MASENIITVTTENFEEKVLKAEIPVLVDFWASWCGPCRAVAPVMEEIASDYEGKIFVGKVNVDDQSELAQKFRIMSIPTIMLFKNGEVVEKMVGSKSKSEFAQVIDKNI